MPLQKGTLIFANYTAKVKDTGEGIESTSEDEAKKLNIHDPERKYEPRLIAVGEGWVIGGLDDEVAKMDVGQKKQIELSPEKAFGLRDPAQLRMMPLRKFGERAHEMTVGDTVEVDNRVGVVRFIGSGRAQIDFNHRLAGKTIVYDFEVVRKVETDDDKLRALIDRRFAGEGSKVSFGLKGTELEVTIPEELFLLEGLQIVKRGVSSDVFKFLPQVTSLTFEEKFVNKKAEEKKEAKEVAEEKKEIAEKKKEIAEEKKEAKAEKAPAPEAKAEAPAQKERRQPKAAKGR
jgi:peptidylprolyl isomerase